MVFCVFKICLYVLCGINIFLVIFVSVLVIYFNILDKEIVENKDVFKLLINIV